MGKYVYGLDLSLKQSGVTVLDIETLKPVYKTSIPTDQIKDTKKNKGLHKNALKLTHIHNKLSEIKEKYPPKVVVIESTFHQFMKATAVLYTVHGVALELFSDVPIKYYRPKEIKERIIKGDAEKELVQKAIKVMFPNIEFANEDESDSFAIAITYLIDNGLIEWDKNKVILGIKNEYSTRKTGVS